MAKKTKNSKMLKGKNQPDAPRRGAKRGRARGVLVARSELVERVSGHTDMVLDPCNSRITPTAYRGQDGFVQRFAKTQAFTTTTESCFINIFYPAYNSIFTYAVGSPSSGVAPVSYGIAGPGQAYLLSSADGMRPIGACVEVDYTGTELNRQGLLYMGSVKSSVFDSVFNLDQITALLGHPIRVPDSTASVKWIPSPSDEEYWNVGAGVPGNGGDRNVIVTVGIGFTDPVSFQLTTTLIAEWQPNFGLGIAANSPNSVDVPGGIEHVRSNLARAGNWWIGAAHSLERGYQTARGIYNATRGVRAGLMALTM